MKFCSHCGKEVMSDALVCPNCGCPIDSASKQHEDDKPDLAHNILALLIPIVGLIMFCVMFSKTPTKAKSIGLCALIGWILGMIIIAISFSV